MLNFKLLLKYTQGNLTSDCEINSLYDNEKKRKTVQAVRFPMSYS